jgi:hypothetical protein
MATPLVALRLRARLGRAATSCGCDSFFRGDGGYEVFIDSHPIGNTTVLTNVFVEVSLAASSSPKMLAGSAGSFAWPAATPTTA